MRLACWWLMPVVDHRRQLWSAPAVDVMVLIIWSSRHWRCWKSRCWGGGHPHNRSQEGVAQQALHLLHKERMPCIQGPKVLSWCKQNSIGMRLQLVHELSRAWTCKLRISSWYLVFAPIGCTWRVQAVDTCVLELWPLERDD